MEELFDLKKNIRDLLTSRMGELTEEDLSIFRKHAFDLNLDQRQFSKLLQEIYSSINWDKVRDEQEGSNRVVGKPIPLYGNEVKSLHKLGQVLFENREKALRYLEDNIFLKENVTYLSHQNVDLTLDLLDIYAAEKNPEKRFLKIVYQLNPSLPFTIDNEPFSTLDELFDRAWIQYEFYELLYGKFVRGHLQIWVQNCFEDEAKLLPNGNSLTDFLFFVYSYNASYPIYIDRSLFLHPEDIVKKAKHDADFWSPLFKSVKALELFIWFEKRNLSDLILSYTNKVKGLDKGSKDADTIAYSHIQKLLETIAAEMPLPNLDVSVSRLDFIGIEAKPIVKPVVISLTNEGFVTAFISLDQQHNGISVKSTKVSFFDIIGPKSYSLALSIEPKKLIKNKLYTANIRVITDYQSLSIPVAVKTVFPKRAFLLCLLKYAFFGGTFFGLIRIMIVWAESGSHWLAPEVAWENISEQVPSNHVAYIFFILCAILIPILIWPKIKKIEQL